MKQFFKDILAYLPSILFRTSAFIKSLKLDFTNLRAQNDNYYFKIIVGFRIKEVRIKANLSQKEFAELIGISQSMITEYEQGRKTPEIKSLKQISLISGRSLSWLLTGRSELSAKQNKILSRLTERELDVLRLLIDGKTNEEIISALDMTATTLYKHYSRIKRTLGYNGSQGRAEYISFLMHNNLIVN